MWILRDNFDNLSLSKEYGLSYDDIVSDTTGDNDKGLNLYNLKDYLGGGAGWPERGHEFWVSRFNSNDLILVPEEQILRGELRNS